MGAAQSTCDAHSARVAIGPTTGVMAARQVRNGTDAEINGNAASARSSWSRCEAALAGSRISVAASDPDGRYTWIFNPPSEFPAELVGKLDREAFPPDTAEALAAAKHAVLVSGEPLEISLELVGERGPRWYEVSVREHREHGRVLGTVSSFIDMSDRKVQEEHLRIVMRELTHRSKNLLAVIQGIARQTGESTDSIQQFVSRFNGRIFSLSRAHDVLTDADWRGARIFDLIRSQIALYAENRLESVTVAGDNAFLRPNAAQYVGLALHELTTNALKYGALSRDDGTIVARFETSSSTPSSYRLSWREMSSAQVREPKGRSFGLIMLTEVVPTSVGGTAELKVGPQGLSYELEIPKAQLAA
jgi:two-component sensor histidine kinase